MTNQLPSSPLDERRLDGYAKFYDNKQFEFGASEQPHSREVDEALRRTMAAYTQRKHEIHPAGELSSTAVQGAKVETSVPRVSLERIAGIGVAFETVRRQMVEDQRAA